MEQDDFGVALFVIIGVNFFGGSGIIFMDFLLLFIHFKGFLCYLFFGGVMGVGEVGGADGRLIVK